MRQAGFSLPEMLIALAIGSVLLLGAARMLPLLQYNNLQTLMRFQLQEELQLIATTLEKAVRRAGYCKGECAGKALSIGESGHCLLVRWDGNSNGRWEGGENAESDLYGYRLREGSLEIQRGVDSCSGGGWEKVSDPATVLVEDFLVTRNEKQIRLRIAASAKAFPQQKIALERWITAGNL